MIYLKKKKKKRKITHYKRALIMWDKNRNRNNNHIVNQYPMFYNFFLKEIKDI